MPRFLFDTDHLTLYEHLHGKVHQRLAAEPPGSVGISPVTVEEALRGRLAYLARQRSGPLHVQAYALLVGTIELFRNFPIVPYDPNSDYQYQQLIPLRLRIGTNDLKIGAVALAHKLTLVTRNRSDFARIPGLTLEDWSI